MTYGKSDCSFTAPADPIHQSQLDSQGYAVLPGYCSTEVLNALRRCVDDLYLLEGDEAGAEFRQEPGSRRLANLIDKGEVFQGLAADEGILPLVTHVLGRDFKLSSLNARAAEAMNHTAQPLHCDMGGLPDNNGFWVCNTVWMLDDFTAENGAIRAVPGTHRSGQTPQDALQDPLAAHPDELLITGSAGTVVVMNAHLWHGGTENRTTATRRAVHVFYCRRDKPQQQHQRALVRPEVQATLTPRLRWILALDDSLNDQVSASPTVRSGFLQE